MVAGVTDPNSQGEIGLLPSVGVEGMFRIPHDSGDCFLFLQGLVIVGEVCSNPTQEVLLRAQNGIKQPSGFIFQAENPAPGRC